MKPALRPVDRWIAFYNLILAVVWLGPVFRSPDAGLGLMGFAVHLAAALLPWLLVRQPLPAFPGMRLLRDGYPLVVLGAAWSELGWLQAVRQAPTHDVFIQELDLKMFGFHAHAGWLPSMPWLSEPMHGVYLGYYLLVFLPPLVLAARGRTTAYRDWCFRLLVTYLGCYLAYIAFPVAGPRLLTPPAVGPHTDGFFYMLTHGARELGDSVGTAFPSSHVAGVVTSAFLAWKWLSRPAARWFAAGAVAVCASTVYTQNHYLVDVAAGIAAAAVLQAAAAHFTGRPPSAGIVPILPALDFAAGCADREDRS